MYQQLKQLINTKKARIAVIGLGYVGLPIVIEFIKKGFFVYGVDNNEHRITDLKKGISYITDFSQKDIRAAIKTNRFIPTKEESVLNKSDIIIICVPTPLRKTKLPDVSYIIAATKSIATYLRAGQLIILESTTYPGTTREVMLPILEKKNLKEGKDFFLAFSPERIDPGNKKYTLPKIPKVVGGISEKSGELTGLIYSKIIKKIHRVSSVEAAEVVKLLENTFRIVNLGLINEFAILCDKLKINVWEIVEAAKTKPFGFMPFYPGPGIGGHCLDGNEFIFVKNGNGLETTTIKSFIEKIENKTDVIKKSINGVEYFKPFSYQMLTFDPEEKKTVFRPITMLSRRNTDEELFNIRTNDNRQITVTGGHPMFALSGRQMELKFAQDLQIGDLLPFAVKTEYENLRPNNEKLKLDLIEILKEQPNFIKRIRVKPKNYSWHCLRNDIYKINFDYEYYHDYIRYNSLPLRYFMEGEQKNILSVKHDDLLLCCGRGPSYSEVPAVINITADFCRLIGYYLSEGCITCDGSTRVRFTFNAGEVEYIHDLCGILKKIGLKYSIYRSKKCNALHIKISSRIFGFLLTDVLRCGKNCYEMSIPSLFFSMPKTFRWELLKGIMRGDGGVDIREGKRAYIKNKKEYRHFSNSAGINYFSSSKKLFQQVILLLSEFNLVPTFKKREGLLYIFGHKQLSRLKDIFLGDKKNKINSYFSNVRKIMPNRSFEMHGGFITSTIKSIERVSASHVYSAETDDTHTIVSSYGVIVHNCIPIDPLYLSWKAKKVGFKTKMIDLASKINLFIPHYVVHRIENILRVRGINITKAKVLILGATYKKDVKDLRESPALEIIEILQNKKANVNYHDPYISYLRINSIDLTSVTMNANTLRKQDIVILVTDHSNLDYKFIAKHAALIFDTRNAFGRRKIYRKNIIRL